VKLLDDAAAKAPDAEAASTYDNARAESYLALGKGAEAVALLEASEKRLPDDYNPPARLARVLHKLGKDKDALAAIQRALGKAYGPRKLGFYKLEAEIQASLGDTAGEVATLESEIKGYEELPDGQKRPAALEDARARLAKASDGADGGR
jgi:predicted Zn-dependent protease